MTQSLIEPLEGRRFLAAHPFLQLAAEPVTGPVAWPSSNYVVKAVASSTGGTTATASATATVRATDLAHDWTGTVKAKLFLFSKKFDAELHVTQQTPTTLKGSIKIRGHSYSGTFVGKINPATGRFNWELKDGGDGIKITGRLNTAGTVAVGDIKAEYGGFDVKGSFRLERA